MDEELLEYIYNNLDKLPKKVTETSYKNKLVRSGYNEKEARALSFFLTVKISEYLNN